MTMDLYTLHSTPAEGEFIIQKFDTDYHCESVYALSSSTCMCPQGHKDKCRHRTMLPMFLAHDHIGDGWFLEWNTRMWRKPVGNLMDIGKGLEQSPWVKHGPGMVEIDHSNLLADETVMGTSASAEGTATLTSPPTGVRSPLPEAPPPSPPEGPQPSLSAEAAPASPVVAGVIVKRRKIP